MINQFIFMLSAYEKCYVDIILFFDLYEYNMRWRINVLSVNAIQNDIFTLIATWAEATCYMYIMLLRLKESTISLRYNYWLHFMFQDFQETRSKYTTNSDTYLLKYLRIVLLFVILPLKMVLQTNCFR